MMQAMFQFESAEISKEHLPEMVKISKEGIYCKKDRSIGVLLTTILSICSPTSMYEHYSSKFIFSSLYTALLALFLTVCLLRVWMYKFLVRVNNLGQ